MSDVWSVLVTGPATHPEPWLAAARAAGWDPIAWPLLECVEGPEMIEVDVLPDWIAVTSSNAIPALEAAAAAKPLLKRVPLAVVGDATAERLFQAGWEPRVVPAPGASHAAGLAKALMAECEPSSSILWPRSVRAQEFGNAMTGAGHTVADPATYDVAPRVSEDAPPRTDVVFFASPSAVKVWLELGSNWQPAVLAIGWTTFEAVLEHAEQFSITVPLAAPEPTAFGQALESFVPAE